MHGLNRYGWISDHHILHLASRLPLSALRLKSAEVAAAVSWFSSSLSASPSWTSSIKMMSKIKMMSNFDSQRWA